MNCKFKAFNWPVSAYTTRTNDNQGNQIYQ